MPWISEAICFCSSDNASAWRIASWMSRSARPPWLRCSCSCACRIRSSAACACAPPSRPFAAACLIALAASCSCLAASARSWRCCSRVSCSSRRAASSASFASWRCARFRPAAAAGRLRRYGAAVRLLLLAPGQLLQLLRDFVDLLVSGLLLGALLHLVLVRQLVEFEFEEVGQVFGHLLLPPPPPPPPRAAHLHFVFLLGVLQQLQRPLLGRQRFLRLLALQSPSAVFISWPPWQRLGDRLERGSTASRRLFILPLNSSTCSRSSPARA